MLFLRIVFAIALTLLYVVQDTGIENERLLLLLLNIISKLSS
jgi:hypothetical protein